MIRKPPSLVNLCVQTAIDNVRHLGNVGDVELHLLDHILPHCTLEQLMHVEKCTKGRDLSPVTDKVWKKYYERKFGAQSALEVTKKMIRYDVNFTWRQLFKAKAKEVETMQWESLAQTKVKYKYEKAKEKGVKMCTKVPPSKCKRSFSGGTGRYSISNTKSNILKKAKLEYNNCERVKNLSAMKNMAARCKPR